MAGMSARILTAFVLLIHPTISRLPSPTSLSQSLHAESERYSVDALDTGANDRSARVIVSDNVTSRRHMVMVNSTLGELKRAVIRDDQQRITLVCRKGFAVLDPSGVVNTDEVYGLDAVVSPGGRWIAYRRFFPPTHPGPSEGIVVYDTKQSREKNHSEYPIVQERDWRAGRAVFPAAEEWKDANAVVAPNDAYLLTSPISWEENRENPALLFSMRRDDQEMVVLAAAAGQNDQLRVCWTTLPGAAERWRVKTLTYKRSDDARLVTVSSSAQADAAETTVRFGANCAGEVKQ